MSFPLAEDTARSLQLKRGFSPCFRFPAYKTMGNKFLLFINHPVCGILLKSRPKTFRRIHTQVLETSLGPKTLIASKLDISIS